MKKFDINDLEGGPFHSLEDLNKALAAHIQKVNNGPVADFEGLSPTQMDLLLRHTFEPGSFLKLKVPTNEQLAKSPFFMLVIDLLEAVQAAGEFKATSKGNLPVKVCKELYAKEHIKHDMIESGITKANKEEDFQAIHAAHIVTKLAGFLRKYKGKIVLTKKGEKLLKSDQHPELFTELLLAYGKDFNWGYLDGIENQQIPQAQKGFLLYLLHKFGKEGHFATFYADKIDIAFPMLKNEVVSNWGKPFERLVSAVEIRFFSHFVEWFGFVAIVGEEGAGWRSTKKYQKTALMDAVFGFGN